MPARLAIAGVLPDHYPAWKAGAAGGVLDIGNAVRMRGQRLLLSGRESIKTLRIRHHAQAETGAGFFQKRQIALGSHGDARVAAREQALQLGDIGRMRAELDRGGQRDGNQSGVLTGIEKKRRKCGSVSATSATRSPWDRPRARSLRASATASMRSERYESRV